MMLWAAAALCFFGFLRPGDVVAPAETQFDPSVNLVCGGVRVDSIVDPHYLVVVIKASKTDVFRKGTRTPKETLCAVAQELVHQK